MKSIEQIGKMYFGRVWIRKRPVIRLICMEYGRRQECMELEENRCRVLYSS